MTYVVSQRTLLLAAMKRTYGPNVRVKNLDELIAKHGGDTPALIAAVDAEVKRDA